MRNKFKVYYKDGSTYSGQEPENTPVFDVLVIVEGDADHGRRIISNGDYYGWADGRWRAYDYPGLIQYLKDPGWKRVLLGVMVNGELWNKIYARANSDNDFPPRTAYNSHEARAV